MLTDEQLLSGVLTLILDAIAPLLTLFHAGNPP